MTTEIRSRRRLALWPVGLGLGFVLFASGWGHEAPEAALGFRCGAAAVTLEADDSMVIAGGIGPGGAEGQEGELRAVATVIALGEERVALVACDVLMMRRDYLDSAARRIAEDVGIPFSNVLINATHTHHAPSTVTIHDYGRNDGFCAHVRDAIVESVRRAEGRLKKAGRMEFLFRVGEESSVGQNSRLLLSDGTIYWTGNRDDVVRPTGPFDPELPVLAFRRSDGALEALLFNHSTHAIGTVQPGVRSPSFYGLAAQGIEKTEGGTVLFLSGAFGSTHNLTVRPAEMKHRIETAVFEALRKAVPHGPPYLRSLKREVPYRVRKFDEQQEDQAVSVYCRRRLGPGADYVIGVFRKMRKRLAPHQGEERTTWIQVVRVADVAIVAMPGELFTSLGVEIKRLSPFRYTYVAGVANDYLGYLPDAKAYELGGYQVWTGLHSFVEKGTGERFTAEAIRMLEELR